MKSYIKRGIKYILKGPEVIIHKPQLNVNITYTSPSQLLTGKKILITGGNKGIGLALSKKFVAEGADIVITGRDVKSLRTVSESLKCKYICADLQEIESLENIVLEANDILKGINCLVNNAGVSLHEGNICNVSEQQFDIQFKTNLKAAYFLSQHFIKIVKENGTKESNILFVSSERGTYVDDLPYGITKNAVNCLVKGLARRVITRGIRVNAVAPGITATSLTGYAEDDNLYLESGMSKRIYLPDEVAEIGCFLLSDVSRCLNGQILTCDEARSINAYWR